MILGVLSININVCVQQAMEKAMENPTPVLCLENPMDGGAW